MEEKEVSSMDVLSAIWRGEVPIVAQLASSEITSLETPHPFYCMISRMSYISILAEKLETHFEGYVSHTNQGQERESGSRVWFSHKGVPIQWNYPIGVLYDLFMDFETERGVPFDINVHFNFQSFPSQIVSRIRSEKDVQNDYMNSLKRGVYLKTGETKSVMMLSSDDQKKLWESVVTSNLLLYKSVKGNLYTQLSVPESHLVRLVLHDEINGDKFGGNKKDMSEETKKKSSQGKTYALARVVAVDGKVVEEEDFTLAKFLDENLEDKDSFEVIIQGIKPDLSTNMKWIIEMCENPNCQLYVILKKKNE